MFTIWKLLVDITSTTFDELRSFEIVFAVCRVHSSLGGEGRVEAYFSQRLQSRVRVEYIRLVSRELDRDLVALTIDRQHVWQSTRRYCGARGYRTSFCANDNHSPVESHRYGDGVAVRRPANIAGPSGTA